MTKKISTIHQRVNASATRRAEMDKLKKKINKAKENDTPENLSDILKQLSDLNVNMPQNDFWDLAQKHYEMSISAVAHVEGVLVQKLQSIVENDEAFQKLEDPTQLQRNIKVLTKDLVAHIDRLNSIYAQHKDKTGGTKDPDEHIQVININQQYADALEVYEANIVPNTAHVLEQIGTIENALEQLKQSEIQDVNVVTDIEVKQPL